MAAEALYFIGVKAVIVNSQNKILLLQESRRGEPYWEFPGGRIKEGETQEQALRREVAEETGIRDLTIERPLRMGLSSVKLPIETGRRVGIVFDTYICKTKTTHIKLEDGVESNWFTTEQAASFLEQNGKWPAEIIAAVRGLTF